MTLRLKYKIPLLMVGVVVSMVVSILFTVSTIVDRATTVTLENHLDEARNAFQEFQTLRVRETRLLASLPFFKATLRTQDGPTIRLLAEDLQKKIGNDLFIITDGAGEILARTDQATQGPVLCRTP